MTLVFDRRDKLAGQSMAHAFVLGVSEYTHLPAHNQPADPDKFNLKRLGSCALSAWEICRWLVANADALACKLGSIRLLMSPSPEEMAGFVQIDALPASGWLGKSAKDVETADWKHFVEEAGEWRKDAARASKNGLTFFYYSGHGLKQVGKDLITLADFTDPGAGGKLQRSCELIANFILGMAPAANRMEIARNQFYFVDCCREDILDFAGLASSPGTVWDPLPGVDDRATPVFMASHPGSVAQAIRGRVTDFCLGLLNSLEVGADGPDPQEAGKGWPVTSYTLSKALENYFARLRTGQYAPASGISFKNVPLRWLSNPPPVEFSVVIHPTAAISVTTISLKHVKGLLDQEFPPASPDHPYKVRSRAGIHKITAMSTSTFLPYDDFQLINPFWAELPITLSLGPAGSGVSGDGDG